MNFFVSGCLVCSSSSQQTQPFLNFPIYGIFFLHNHFYIYTLTQHIHNDSSAMKLNNILIAAVLASVISAKNVVNLDGLKDSLQREQKDTDKREDGNGHNQHHRLQKRKNLFDLQALQDELNENDKRDEDESAGLKKRKNVVNLNHLKDSPDLKKRKNVIDLNEFKPPSRLSKRRNVVNLNDFKVALEQEEEQGAAIAPNQKRDAKNLFDITKLGQEAQSNHKFDKRSGKQQPLNDKHLLFSVDSVDCYNNLLQSILPQIKLISIFAGYIRDNESINAKTELSNETMVIIAPSDYAIENKLGGLKPWEFPNSVDAAKDDHEQERILKKNLDEFVNGHIITNFESKFIVGTDEDKNPHRIIIVPLNNGKLVRIRQDQITDEFKVRVDGRDDWINVELVRQVENGFIFAINDSLVKP